MNNRKFINGGVSPEKKKIVILTTGGTIASTTDSKQTTLSCQSAETLNQELLKLTVKFDSDFEFEIINIANIASPNLEPEDWVLISSEIARQKDLGVTRFLITHGTDTLHFTSAFLSLQFSKHPLHIYLTGAFYPMNSPKYDGIVNLEYALNVITDKSRKFGVYSCFASHSQTAPAAGILPPNYGDLKFRVLYETLAKEELPFGSIEMMLDALEWQNLNIVTAAQITEAKRRVFLVRLYPGIDMQIFDLLMPNSILILESYHSGTGSATTRDTGILALKKRRQDLKICLASIPSPIVVKPYQVSCTLIDAGIVVFKDLPPHLLYVGSLLGLADGLSADAVVNKFQVFRA